MLETDVFFDVFAVYRAFAVCRAFAVGSNATEIHIETEDEAPRLEIHAAERAADKAVEIPFIAHIQAVNGDFVLVDGDIGLDEAGMDAAIDACPIIGDIAVIVVGGVCR